MRQSFVCSIIVASILLSACTVTKWRRFPVLATPEQFGYEEQIQLFQLSQELRKKKLDDESRMQLLYSRSQLYDKFGMPILAQSDLLRILKIRPDVPEVYNQLGGYAAQAGELDSAYLAYDSALELDPSYSFAYLNRGIALYNGERYPLAVDDFCTFYKVNPEPIILLWIYLAESEQNKKIAEDNLRKAYDNLVDKQAWGIEIIAFYLGKINEQNLFKKVEHNVSDNKILAERLTEVYFYLGKYYQRKGDVESAKTLFKLTLANNVRYFIEYRQASIEIDKLAQIYNGQKD